MTRPVSLSILIRVNKAFLASDVRACFSDSFRAEGIGCHFENVPFRVVYGAILTIDNSANRDNFRSVPWHFAIHQEAEPKIVVGLMLQTELQTKSLSARLLPSDNLSLKIEANSRRIRQPFVDLFCIAKQAKCLLYTFTRTLSSLMNRKVLVAAFGLCVLSEINLVEGKSRSPLKTSWTRTKINFDWWKITSCWNHNITIAD